MCTLHHVAIAVTEYNRYVDLFSRLGMTVQKRAGEAPNRQLWFKEGIQLNEVPEAAVGRAVDHIALGVENVHETVEIALANGCRPIASKAEKWFELPNGVVIELMEI